MLTFGAYFYDRIMKSIENSCLKEWRRDLLKNLEGRVLEIGAGTGASLGQYPEKDNLEVFLLEPDINMRCILEKKIVNCKLEKIEILEGFAENINAEDGYFDSVFVSLVCCSLKNVEKALSEIKRVLKPEGKFLFLEHVASEKGTKRRFFQDYANFIWRPVAGNCHLNRDTESSINKAGFVIEDIKYDDLKTPFPLVKTAIRGIAVKK